LNWQPWWHKNWHWTLKGVCFPRTEAEDLHGESLARKKLSASWKTEPEMLEHLQLLATGHRLSQRQLRELALPKEILENVQAEWISVDGFLGGLPWNTPPLGCIRCGQPLGLSLRRIHKQTKSNQFDVARRRNEH